jgi:Domain of unknown function (DUF1906)
MIIDCDDGFKDNVSFLTKNNVDTVGRYFCRDDDPTAYKLISPKEAKQIADANIRLFTIFEAGQLDLTQGQANAQTAMDCAKKIGQPQKSAIYFGLEKSGGFNTPDLTAIRTYFQAINSTIENKFAVGIYSNGIPCQAMWAEKLCKYTWLTAASYSHFGTQDFFSTGLWSLAQVAPVDIKTDAWIKKWKLDINVANGDFGSFVAAPPVG